MYTTSYLVSFNIPKKGEPGVPLAVIGKKGFKQTVKVVNAIEGEAALELYNQMIGKPFDLFETK